MKLRNTTESIPNHGAARDAAILQDLDLVNRIARSFQRRVPPCVAFDDLAGAGMIGLIQAVDRFDQTRSVKFRTYAQHRIWPRATGLRPRQSAWIRSRYGAWPPRPSPHS
jgi:DNA-directed RNA polymerase specialized sigma subunit